MGLMSALRTGMSYGRRIANVTPEFLLGDTSEIIGQAIKAEKGSIWKKGKAGFKALENYNNAQTGTFFSRLVNNLRNTPTDLANGFKASKAAAKAAGKSGIWGGIKGVGKAVAKKMPLIGAVLTLAIETPNIIGAFANGGFKAGMKEIGGAGVELGCMAAGAAIGSCFGPVGTIVGSIVGGIAGMLVRGKTHSEKKAEEEAAAQEQQAQVVEYTKDEINVLKAYGLTDDEIAQIQSAGYSAQDVVKAVEEELKAQQAALEQELKQAQTLQETPIQSYDPTQAYAYNNLNAVPQTGLNNPYAMYPNMTTTNDKYANDIYYQQLFGTTPTVNPFNDYINNQYQYYV